MPKDEREELIAYLDTHCIDEYGELQTWQVADFILADRKRIVEPLVKYKGLSFFSGEVALRDLNSSVDQTLKNAGVQ